MTAPRILVRGAGVSGLVTALLLAECGAAVTLAEQGERVGSGASWKAGGMLAPWCEAESAPHEILEQAGETIDWWLAHAPDAVRHGSLVLAPARDTTELDRFARRTTGHEWLDRAAIATLEPDLAGRFGRALFFPREAHLDPRLALPALARQLAGLGGRILLGTDAAADGFDRIVAGAAADGFDHIVAGAAADGFDHIVDCRGFAARGELAGLRGVRGEMLLLRCPELRLSRPVRLLHPRFPVYLVPRADHLFMLGATMVESEQTGGVTARAMMELLGAAYALHPAFAEAEIVETGAGLRPSFADNMPRVQEDGGVISVNGMHRHGFLLAPVLARSVAARLGLRQPPGLHR